MRRKLIVGNWKMNGGLEANASLLHAVCEGVRSQLPACDIGVAVPALYLAQVQQLLADSVVALGAQDVSAHISGAFTGEISAGMLREFAVRYVLVGHSERRQYHGESDAAVAAKACAALNAGLTPIVCVGETLQEREAGRTVDVVGRQLAAVLDAVAENAEKLVVAYEPVWAIGTGKTAMPEQAQEVHYRLRQQLCDVSAPNVPLLYGGSMNAANARQLLAQPDVDGGLIGGASLKAEDFLRIIAAAG